MHLYESGEDYLEAVLVLQKKIGEVRSVDVARYVGVSKPSVSHAVSVLCDGGFPFLVALTKSDKLNQTERRQRLAALEEAFSDYEGLRLIPFSSVTGEGVEELREILSSVAEEPEELG